MDTNVQALKGLYAALGGEAADVADLQTSAEVIVALEAVAEAAATELPAVTTSDNGKALVVSGGKWTKGNELPAVTSSNYGSVLKVGASGKWYRFEDAFNNIFIGLGADRVLVSASGAELAKEGLFINVCVSLSGGGNFLFQKVKVDDTNVYYLSTTRASGKTVYKEIIIPKSTTHGTQINVTTTEVADPVTPQSEEVPTA